jgi:hypothetical protein
MYALCKCLAQREPVIWFNDKLRYLFTDEGVFVEPQWCTYPATWFKTHIWALVDADEDGTGVPGRLAVRNTKHLIIYTS